MGVEAAVTRKGRLDLSGSLAAAWVVFGLLFTVVAAIHSATREGVDEVDYFMWGQDIGVLAGVARTSVVLALGAAGRVALLGNVAASTPHAAADA
jgi:hypothetical protein